MKRLTFHRTVAEYRAAFRGSAEGRLRLFFVVYHRGHRARVRRYGTGFQPTPWRCSVCRRVAKTPDELRYALASRPESKAAR